MTQSSIANRIFITAHTVMMIMYIVVLYLILIFINQNNLKKQQQVSMNQTVKFSMS